MRRFLPFVVLAGIPAALSAHPHAEIDQQAHLSLGRTKAVVSFRIVPSTKDGAHMFEYLDSNNDDVLSRSEKRAFANDLLVKAPLTVDGNAVQLRFVDLTFPNREEIVSGTGMIEVTGSAQLSLSKSKPHIVSLAVGYDAFAEDWFLQPFYFADLASARPSPRLNRSKSGAISIRMAAM